MGLFDIAEKTLGKAAKSALHNLSVIPGAPLPLSGTKGELAKQVLRRIPTPEASLAQSFFDNVLRDPVTPVFGSVLYVDLACGYAEHSGIYVGGGEKCIVELTNQKGKCIINRVSPREFVSGGTGSTIYVSSHRGHAAGKKRVGQRALSMVGRNLGDYNIALNNCHMFTNYCLSGKDSSGSDFSAILSMDMTLTSVKIRASEVMDADEWRVWHYKS